MLPQNGHQLRPQYQQPGLPSFMASNPAPSFDPSSYFNLDPTQAAKQMAALTAANQARIANSRPTPTPLPPNGINSGSFLGGITSTNYLAGSQDTTPISSGSAHTNFQMSNNQGLPSIPNSGGVSASFLEHSMSQSNPAARNPMQGSTSLKQRQQGFLQGLANIMAKRNTPLPPALTGVPTPTYDPNNSRWKIIEPSSEIGSFRLAGKDVDLFKLWGLVFQHGGGHALMSSNGWNAILSSFDLPEEFPQPPSNGSMSVAQTLAQYYMALLFPFEDMYKRNIQEHQRRAQLASRQGAVPPLATQSGQGRLPQGLLNTTQPITSGPMQRGGMGNATTMMGQAVGPHTPVLAVNVVPQIPQSHTPQPSLQRPPSTLSHSVQGPLNALPGMPPSESMTIVAQTNGHSSDVNILDQEMQGIKRKMGFDEEDNKRVRQKTAGSEPPENTTSVIVPVVDRISPGPASGAQNVSQVSNTMLVPPRPRQQPTRQKIEYVPLAREVETYGGRDLKHIEAELANLPQRRPLRDINDWGTVDIEALTMSIRSRLSTELSYALTTFTLLSSMRGQTPGSGFPIFQSADLLDEVLDLLEEQAFGDAEDSFDSHTLDRDLHIITNRELVTIVYEGESQPFAVLEPRQGSKDPSLGPSQRPGNIIVTILNIIRNLSTIQDNVDFISRHDRLIDLLLRLCTVIQGKDDGLSPASLTLSLSDLVTVRKDTLYTLINIAGNLHLSPNAITNVTIRTASRLFQLIASYLVDSTEAVSPLACVQLAGYPLNGNLKPPLLADVALDVLTRLSQADANRQVIAKAVPQASIWRLFEALVHRLPVVDADFHLMTRELWLSYLEKNIMAIYSLAFLAPPTLKEKVKADRALGFKAVMLRMIQKFLINNQEGRVWFIVCARRAIETMKVLDDSGDLFDTSKSTIPTMSFGMGYGEIGDTGVEKGVGLLGGHRDVAWDMLMIREVHNDEVMFGELESLARVEC